MIQAIREHCNSIMQEIEADDRRYPNRHKVIHKVACKDCPSMQWIDPEAQQIKDESSKSEIITKYLFVCAWRVSKICKGNCDHMEIDQQQLDEFHANPITPQDEAA